MPKLNYNKKPRSFADQVLLLQERNLTIPNTQKAERVLSTISYNRLSRYWYPFLKEPKEDEIFHTGADFDTIFKIYQFDSKLRTLVFNAIEQIEVAVRTQLIYHMSHKYQSGFWYETKEPFESHQQYIRVLKKISDTVDQTNEAFITKYTNKYEQHLPPAWKAFEIISFRTLYTIYKNLREKDDKQLIADAFNMNSSVFESWIDFLVYIRNICAHHARFWNRSMTIKPIWMKSKNRGPWITKWSDDGPQKIRHKSYVAFCVIAFLMDRINPYHSFKKDLKELILEYPDINAIQDMGFTNGWESEPLWK
jgi:abortive infection bacteriophage resistance protein